MKFYYIFVSDVSRWITKLLNLWKERVLLPPVVKVHLVTKSPYIEKTETVAGLRNDKKEQQLQFLKKAVWKTPKNLCGDVSAAALHWFHNNYWWRMSLCQQFLIMVSVTHTKKDIFWKHIFVSFMINNQKVLNIGDIL